MDKNLVTTIRNAVLDMMNKVSIDENHVYTRNDNGEWLQGVTEVSSIVPKEWLSAWGSKEAVKALGFSDYEGDTENAVQVLKKIKACKTIEEYIAILKEAKGAARKKSKEALVDGKKGHEWLENFVKAKIRLSDLPSIPTEGNLVRAINSFLAWQEENIDYWILSEARVCYPEKGYAGTLDGLAMTKKGKLAIIDFKFASHIAPEYYLQTAGYQATFEPYGIKIDERIIVRLPKTTHLDEWNKKEKKYEKVENTIEVQIVPTPYEFDRDTFFHALPVKKWVNHVQKDA